MWFKVIILILCLLSGDGARILGVYPTPSISHQVVFRALTLELVKRGHELVVITPDPVFRNKKAPDNITEIDIGKSYELLQSILLNDVSQIMERGVIINLLSVLKLDPKTIMGFSLDIFNYPEVKNLINDRSQKFDLVIVEGLSLSPLIFSKLFDTPAVVFSSFYGSPDNLSTVGALTRHPFLHPHLYRHRFRDLSFFERIEELKNEWDIYQFEMTYEQLENDFLKSEFGADAPTVRDLKHNVELLFVNSHPIFDGNRPVPPGVVYLGALHLQPVKELPQELKSYLDNSPRGVIYVSLGTNVRPSMMDGDLLDAFLDAFEALPFDIMWKFDEDNLKRKPDNVRIQKWFPQRDLLGHPNVKLFVTQGGLQSTDEAIDAGLPMVGIPFLGDQWFNVNKYVELGIGVEVDARTMVAEDLVKAAEKVIGDDSYRKNIIKLRSEMRDQPMAPLDRAVWWTEYVLRHGHSKRLLGPSALMSWSEYIAADIVIFLALVCIVAATIVAVVLYYLIRIALNVHRRVKLKQS